MYDFCLSSNISARRTKVENGLQRSTRECEGRLTQNATLSNVAIKARDKLQRGTRYYSRGVKPSVGQALSWFVCICVQTAVCFFVPKILLVRLVRTFLDSQPLLGYKSRKYMDPHRDASIPRRWFSFYVSQSQDKG